MNLTLFRVHFKINTGLNGVLLNKSMHNGLIRIKLDSYRYSYGPLSRRNSFVICSNY